VEFTPLSDDLFKYLTAAVDKHFTLESLLATKKSFEEQIVRLQTSIEQINNEMDKVDKERLEIGRKLTIACPHCGGAVPIAELEI
jgi:peptidoglycan hydrolase CwlO-like protein